jgi:hypothetical protein
VYIDVIIGNCAASHFGLGLVDPLLISLIVSMIRLLVMVVRDGLHDRLNAIEVDWS